MSDTVDTIGRIPVPTPPSSGQTFPPQVVSEFGYGQTRGYQYISHRFGDLATLAEQTYLVGIGPRIFPFRRTNLSYADRDALWNFWEAMQGPYQSFTYAAPQPDKSFVDYPVIFEAAPLSIEELVHSCRTGFNLIECFDPANAPSLPVSATCLRFPSPALQTALESTVQQIIPLIHIRVREAGVPDIWLSDRRLTLNAGGGGVQSAMGWVGSAQLYLPRITGLGEPGGNVILTQDLSGRSDNVRFTFGNADRVMTRLANDTDLLYASIDLCLYHVQSTILLQYWKGSILSWHMDGSAQFAVNASDGLYQANLLYPARIASRQCWKNFDDGKWCPYSSAGSGGDPTKCDYYFDSANGCQSHGMANYFGGQPAQPQGVNIKDNSTGVFGIGRNNVTATSIISDTWWGQALPDVWCNQGSLGLIGAMWVNATVVDVRDESPFFDMLGVVGAGPIGEYAGMAVVTNADGYKYVVAPLGDGFPPQGFKVDIQLNIKSDTTLGLREVIGTDPATGTEDGAGSFSLGEGTPQVWGPQRAAGVAFVELRYAKPSAIAPSTPDQHQMQVPISQGLYGRTWDAGDSASFVPGLTNPFWVAINTWLRGSGLAPRASDTSEEIAAQLATFVRAAVDAGDGSGCAEIADLSVPVLLGTGDETQFLFQGTVAQQKPLRDWLTEILSCALGYYTFEFGKLKLGIRENASAVTAFTIGNMLYQSLSLEPVLPAFEHLIVNFADVAYRYQANTCEYSDKDHAAYYGRAGSPLTANQHVVGCSTLSQAARIAAVRTREEIGGIDANEWKTLRRATWKSTLLALDTAVGQVSSVTHPDMPGSYDPDVWPAESWRTGVQNLRVERVQLHTDWSITIQGKTVTASMYELESGPKPLDVLPGPLPVLFYPQPLGQWGPWSAGAQALGSDPLFPEEFSFSIEQSYDESADGTILAAARIGGVMPTNRFIPNCGAPILKSGSITQSTTGGFLPGGTTLRLVVCALDPVRGHFSPPSDVLIVQIPTGTETNKVTIHAVSWPAVAAATRGAIFVAAADDLIQMSAVVGQPADLEVVGPLPDRYANAVPNPAIRTLRVASKLAIHSGVAAGEVTAASNDALPSITVSDLADLTATDDWSGRVLSVIGRVTGPNPYLNFRILFFDPPTGMFSVDGPVIVDGRDDLSVLPGDIVVVRNLGYDNSADPYTVADAGYVNAENGHLGLTPDAEAGNVFRVIAGTNRGARATIVGNTATALSLDQAVYLDATSVWIVEAPNWDFTADKEVNNAAYATGVSLSLPIANYRQETILTAAFIIDTDGNVTDDGNAPLREMYVYGAPWKELIRASFAAPQVGDVSDIYIVEVGGQPYTAYMTAATPSSAGPVHIDIRYSQDGGATWTSLFLGGLAGEPTLSAGQQVGAAVAAANFAVVTLDPGDLVQFVVPSGSAEDAVSVNVVVKLK